MVGMDAWCLVELADSVNHRSTSILRTNVRSTNDCQMETYTVLAPRPPFFIQFAH